MPSPCRSVRGSQESPPRLDPMPEAATPPTAKPIPIRVGDHPPGEFFVTSLTVEILEHEEQAVVPDPTNPVTHVCDPAHAAVVGTKPTQRRSRLARQSVWVSGLGPRVVAARCGSKTTAWARRRSADRRWSRMAGGSRYVRPGTARHWQANLTASPCNNAQQTREGEDAGNSQADA